MNSKQWIYIYETIKSFVETYKGKPPDDQATSKLMDLYENIMSHSINDRAKSKDMDSQLTNIFDYLFKIIHCLELEGKPI
ncbi:MAG: hypothetical protein Q4G23_03315 [Clostridia bacterium]|nr:hypothetical protein [Clostridia bacterium]